MANFNFDFVNDENTLTTPLGSHSSLVEEFVPQSSIVAVGATVDTLVIEFN